MANIHVFLNVSVCSFSPLYILTLHFKYMYLVGCRLDRMRNWKTDRHALFIIFS